ncbi:MAG: hypothetical protein RR514_07705 [Christensenella sp.]
MTRQELLQVAKPILFNTEMVKAILKGKKSCTRRVLKPQIPNNLVEIHLVDPIGNLMFKTSDRLLGGWQNRQAPYQVDNYLYVRETWSDPSGEGYPYWYKADFPLHRAADEVEIRIPVDLVANDYIWSPSIHMPKTAARLFLRVTDVRVERLQDITIDGIEHEGIQLTYPPVNFISSEHLKQFIDLWDSTVKKQDIDRYGWKANPWVWVIEFERVTADERH